MLLVLKNRHIAVLMHENVAEISTLDHEHFISA